MPCTVQRSSAFRPSSACSDALPCPCCHALIPALRQTSHPSPCSKALPSVHLGQTALRQTCLAGLAAWQSGKGTAGCTKQPCNCHSSSTAGAGLAPLSPRTVSSAWPKASCSGEGFHCPQKIITRRLRVLEERAGGGGTPRLLGRRTADSVSSPLSLPVFQASPSRVQPARGGPSPSYQACGKAVTIT